MLIEQLIDLKKVKTDNLQFRTDLKIELWMDGQWQSRLLFTNAADCSKIFKSKLEARPDMLVTTWLSNIAF